MNVHEPTALETQPISINLYYRTETVPLPSFSKLEIAIPYVRNPISP